MTTQEKLNRYDGDIQILKDEIDTLKTSNWYDFFGNETKRGQDILMLQLQLRSALKIKYSLLENRKREIELEKADISQMERELTLEIEGVKI